MTEFKFALFDCCKKLGIAWERPDGKREAIRITIPEQFVEKLQNVRHERWESKDD